MLKLKNSLIIALFISSAMGLGAFWMFQRQQEAKIDEIDAKEDPSSLALKIAQDLIDKSHPRQAIAFIRLNENIPLENESWTRLMLQAAKDLKDTETLQALYEQNPKLITGQEDLSLLLAEHALLTNNFDLYLPLYDAWKSQRQNDASWILLESDSLTLRGEPEKAVALLKSQKFQNKNDEETKRLIRLALLHENEHPKVAFDYLTQAFPSSRQQEDLHYYRAKVLEEGAHHDLALREYREAVQKNQDDPFYADELLNAYLAQGKLQDAYQLAETALKQPINGGIWLKAYFLNNIYRPVSYDFAKNPLPAGDLNPLIRYLSALSPNEIWNDARIKSSPEAEKLANASPEMLWLQALFALDFGQEEKGFQILKDHPEIAKLSPNLYSGLQQVVAYRHPELNLSPAPIASNEKGKHSIFTLLKTTPYSPSIQALLTSKDAYSALFLAAGWNESALCMLEDGVLPSDFPRWVAYGFTQAFILNRGTQEALDFAVKQNTTPQLTLLIGELDLKLGHDADAERRLASLLKSPSEIGAKAAKLLASSYASQGIFAKSKEIAENNPHFSKSLSGQEFIAHMDLKMGNIKEAEEIYQKILNQSPVAKSYVAMQAYQTGKYTLAYKLTRELLDKYPDRQDLKDRIVQIRKAAKEAEKVSEQKPLKGEPDVKSNSI
jgi:tetratricopeptide (TPR) repeat protein